MSDAGTVEGRRLARTIAALVPALAMVGIDNTVTTTALPTIARFFESPISDLQWVVAAYSLSVATFLPISATIGDYFGRRRAVLAGYAAFALGSLVASAAPTVPVLLAARLPQGVGTALMLPNALALLGLTFPLGVRGKAIGLWSGAASFGLLAGPLVGGALIERFGWQAIYFPNQAVAILGLLAVWRWVADVGERRRAPVDLAGLATASVVLFSLTFGLVEAGRRGFADPLVVVALIAAAVGTVAFVARERQAAHPLFDLALVADRSFGPVLAITAAAHVGLMSGFFFVSIYLQSLRDLPATTAGLVLTAFTAPLVVAPPVGGRLTDRLGWRTPLMVALALLAAGIGALAFAGPNTPLGLVAVALAVAALGGGLMLSAESTAVVSVPPAEQVSAASASLSASRQFGISLGVATTGTVAALVLRTRLAADLARAGVEPSLGAALAHGSKLTSAPRFPAGTDPSIVEAALEATRVAAFDAYGVAMGMCGAALVAALAIAVLRLRDVPK